MRTKSNAKRQAILDVAAQAFQQLGYERTSMCEIRARVGGSKATLYNYFASKEELFFAVIEAATESEIEAIYTYLDPYAEDITAALTAFGERLLRTVYTPCSIALRRLIIAEASRSALGRLCYERGSKRGQIRLAAFLRALMAQGRLPEADARVAAWHLYGLLEAELLSRSLLCADETVTEDEIAGCVHRAIAVFLAAYGPAKPVAATETDRPAACADNAAAIAPDL